MRISVLVAALVLDVVVAVIRTPSPRHCDLVITRRSALASSILAISSSLGTPANAKMVDGQQMQRDAELTTSPLIEELKRKTAENKEKNAASVKSLTSTMGSVYDPQLKMVRYQGENDIAPVTRMFSPEQIKELKSRGFELDCPDWGGACELRAAARKPPPEPTPPPEAEPTAPPAAETIADP